MTALTFREPYAELSAISNFSFLRGASHPEDLVARALLLGHTGLGIADHNSVAGVVRAYAALEEYRRDGLPAPQKVRDGSGPGEHVWVQHERADDWAHLSDLLKARAQAFKLATGSRFVFTCGAPNVVAYPQDRSGWATICRLLTAGKRRAPKGQCHITL
ncbi:MAG: polymerase alpha subunit, partial [Pseudomonadota bacterium]